MCRFERLVLELSNYALNVVLARDLSHESPSVVSEMELSDVDTKEAVKDLSVRNESIEIASRGLTKNVKIVNH